MIPKSLQAVLWSRKVDNLDLKKDRNYIVHQVLAYGRWEHLQWLFKTYSLDKLKQVFIDHPEKDYTNPSYNFVKNHLLKITETLDERKYIRFYPRSIAHMSN